MIKAVLFDFGGVLAEEGFRNGLVALAREQGLETDAMPALGLRAVYDSGFVTGRGSAADFWALMRERTGITGDEDVLSQRLLAGFVLRPWMMELVGRLSERGLVTGILSDQTHWLDLLDRRYHFYAAFDHVFNSYYLGKSKQDASLFTEVAADLALPPSSILFVDDDGGNVERARSAGLQALRYASREQLEEDLARVLPGV